MAKRELTYIVASLKANYRLDTLLTLVGLARSGACIVTMLACLASKNNVVSHFAPRQSSSSRA